MMRMLIPCSRRLFRLCLPFIATAFCVSAPAAAQEGSGETSARYEKAAEGCAGGNANNCQSALSLFARDISNDDIGPAIAMLRENCTGKSVTACEALVSAYGSFQNSSVEGTIRIGIDNPELRNAALRMGCAQMLVTENTCGELARELAETGDIAGASAAYDRGCGYVRGLAADSRIYINDWDCYNAAKHALLRARDYAGARRDFQLVCSGDTAGLSPYGCKYLGRMYEYGLGVAEDRDKARDFYAQSCFHQRVEDSDGEGCLLYGQRLIEDRRRVWIRESDIGEGDTMPADPHAVMAHFALEEASRAFQRGCATAIPLACEANETLLQRLLHGEFGFQTTRCFVRDRGDPRLAPRTCRSVMRYPNHQSRAESSSSLTETIYIWPDGDRTVLRKADTIWRLNGNLTAGPSLHQTYNCTSIPKQTASFACRA